MKKRGGGIACESLFLLKMFPWRLLGEGMNSTQTGCCQVERQHFSEELTVMPLPYTKRAARSA